MHLQMNWPRRLTWWVTGRQVCAKCINLHHSTAATNAESCRPFFAAHQHPGPLMLARVQNTSVKNNNSNNSWLPRCIHFFAAAHNACIEIQATVHGAAKLSLLTLRLDEAPVSQIHSQKQPVHPSLKKGASSPAGHLVSRRFPDSGYCFACPPVPTCSSGREFL